MTSKATTVSNTTSTDIKTTAPATTKQPISITSSTKISAKTNPPADPDQDFDQVTPPSSQAGESSWTYLDDFENEVLNLVNKERAGAGLQPVKSSQGLHEAARVRAKELTKQIDHLRPDGSRFYTAIKIPCLASAENLAVGQSSAQEVMNAWMNSTGHKANILNPDLTHLGVGCYGSSYHNALHWIQIFALIPSSEKYHNNAYDEEVVRLINQERSQHGLELYSMARQTHELAKQQAVYYSQHNSFPSGSYPFQHCVKTVLIGSWGSNALDTPQKLFSSLKERYSNEIILADYSHIGIGYYHSWEGNFIHWWGVVAGDPCD
ncbi:MAG: hypothetical protein GX838_00010 [Clostridiaceae bacterium]|nr:hypothetical protein [Clostridiaceae bacterium]